MEYDFEGWTVTSDMDFLSSGHYNSDKSRFYFNYGTVIDGEATIISRSIPVFQFLRFTSSWENDGFANSFSKYDVGFGNHNFGYGGYVSATEGGGSLLENIKNINATASCFGASLKKHGGNSTFGSNGKFYWHAANTKGFYGNQYVSAVKLTNVGKGITKVTGPIGFALSGYELYKSYLLDNQTIGYNTVRTTADITSGWMGAWLGLRAGGYAGGAIGGCFGGIGAIPGAIVGGFIGGIVGAFGGSYFGTLATDNIYGR